METCSMNLGWVFVAALIPTIIFLSHLFFARCPECRRFLHSGLVRYSKKTKEIGTFASNCGHEPGRG